jgi:hypothetical protein
MFNEIFDDVFNDDFSNEMKDGLSVINNYDKALFGKPFGKFFTDFTQDVHPVHWVKLFKPDNGDNSFNDNYDHFRASVRAVGVNKNDIKATMQGKNIKISGTTDSRGIQYHFYENIPISDELLDRLVRIKGEAENGMAYIYLDAKKTKEEEEAEQNKEKSVKIDIE